ncbi:MAG: cold shock domain-containing protein [Pseudomonadota bacterium]
MKNFVTALVSALLFAVILTEIYSRLFAGSYLALLVLTFLAISIVSLANIRLAALRAGIIAPAADDAEPEPARKRSRSRGGRGRGKSSGESNEAAGERDGGKSNRGGDKSNGNKKNDQRGSKPVANKTPPPVPDGSRESGTVKWFNRSKGFGFIVRENGEEIFVHHRSIRSDDDSRRANLRDGQAVSFVVTDHNKGLQAEDVTGD